MSLFTITRSQLECAAKLPIIVVLAECVFVQKALGAAAAHARGRSEEEAV